MIFILTTVSLYNYLYLKLKMSLDYTEGYKIVILIYVFLIKQSLKQFYLI